MRRFQFRLNTLQRLREQKRDAAQRDLVEAEIRRDQVKANGQDVRRDLQGLESHMRESMKKQQLDVDRAMDGHRHQLSLQAKLARLNKALEEANQYVAECREKLVEADRNVKTLEKLHERQLEQHNQQIAAHEAQQLDEAASLREVRKIRTA